MAIYFHFGSPGAGSADEAAVTLQERAEHVRDEVRDRLGLAIGLSIRVGIVGQRPTEIGCNVDTELDRRPVGKSREFQVWHGQLLVAPGGEDQVAVNHKPDRGARPDRDRWLNLQILRDELIPYVRRIRKPTYRSGGRGSAATAPA